MDQYPHIYIAQILRDLATCHSKISELKQEIKRKNVELLRVQTALGVRVDEFDEETLLMAHEREQFQAERENWLRQQSKLSSQVAALAAERDELRTRIQVRDRVIERQNDHMTYLKDEHLKRRNELNQGLKDLQDVSNSIRVEMAAEQSEKVAESERNNWSLETRLAGLEKEKCEVARRLQGTIVSLQNDLMDTRIALASAIERGRNREETRPHISVSGQTSTSARERQESESAQVSHASAANYLSDLPIGRWNVLNQPPTIPRDNLPATYESFSKQFLANALGGNVQSLIVRIAAGREKPLAGQRNIHKYMCPRRDQNPWVPYRPGLHGYMFVGLGAEWNTFVEEETLPLFVGTATKQYFYAGMYKVERAQPLTVAEWSGLPEKVQASYSEITYTKGKPAGYTSARAVRDGYDAGRLDVPCVRLTCIKFDHDLYRGLLHQLEAGSTPSPAPIMLRINKRGLNSISSASESSVKKTRLSDV